MHRRIAAVAELVPQTACAADIGCDHGQLGALLLQQGKAQHIIATDISESSLAKARRILGGRPDAEFRCGDGLSVLAPGEADTICIAGMGGRQIMRMLEERPDIARRAKALILGPHRNAAELRRFLRRSEYRIGRETVAQDRGHYYTVMRVVPGHDTETDLLWDIIPKGDLKDAVYRDFLSSLLSKMQNRIQILAQAAPDDPDLPALQLYAGRIKLWMD